MKEINAYIPHGGSKQIPRRIVVHAMGEYIINDLGVPTHAAAFLNDLEYSAHLLIAPNGDVFRCHNDYLIAWHARSYNTDSLGIEFLVNGNHDYGSFIKKIKKPYLTDIQYQSGINAVKEWIFSHDISKIDKHSTLSPGRKVDPGDGFPWDNFMRDLSWTQ